MMHRWFGNPHIRHTARLALGAVFVYAGMAKLHDTRALAASVASFRLLPDSWISLFAASLPFYEAIAGFWLIFNWRVRIPSLSILILCAALTIAAGQAWFRGLNVTCNCFGETSHYFTSPPAIFLRGLLLLAIAIIVHRNARVHLLMGESE